ncbi:RNA-binding (RRM/RBD/RNP motifs) family protein [Trifolium repens]|nr:RNA-binding (RRM/RBD/RNP motifs) family protein [Trifolium repens]
MKKGVLTALVLAAELLKEEDLGDVGDQSFASVTMSTVEKGMIKFNGYELNGKLLTVSREKPIREPPKPRPSPPRRSSDSHFRISVTNLPRDVDHGRLEEIFSNYNKQLDESTGYLTMIDETEMNNAVSALDGQDLNGKLLTVGREKPKREQPKPRPRPRAYDSPFGICVTDLPRDIDVGRLEEIFSKHGKVESVEIKIEQFDESSSGYLIMANETDMNNVIAAFDGQVRHKLQLHHW